MFRELSTNLQGWSGGENTLNAILTIRFVASFFMPHPSFVGSNTDTAPLHHLYSIFSILCSGLFPSAYFLRLRREQIVNNYIIHTAAKSDFKCRWPQHIGCNQPIMIFDKSYFIVALFLAIFDMADRAQAAPQPAGLVGDILAGSFSKWQLLKGAIILGLQLYAA